MFTMSIINIHKYTRYSLIDILIADFEALKCFSFVYSINLHLKISYLLVLFS